MARIQVTNVTFYYEGIPLKHHKELLVSAGKYGLVYDDAVQETKQWRETSEKGINLVAEEKYSDLHKVLQDLDFELRQGEHIFLKGENGCGKSSLIKAILEHTIGKQNENTTRSDLGIQVGKQEKEVLKISL